jgi:hypothetical protein
VCPFDVFEVRSIDDADFAALEVLTKLKSVAHGRKTAYTPRAPACQACGKSPPARRRRSSSRARDPRPS